MVSQDVPQLQLAAALLKRYRELEEARAFNNGWASGAGDEAGTVLGQLRAEGLRGCEPRGPCVHKSAAACAPSAVLRRRSVMEGAPARCWVLAGQWRLTYITKLEAVPSRSGSRRSSGPLRRGTRASAALHRGSPGLRPGSGGRRRPPFLPLVGQASPPRSKAL